MNLPVELLLQSEGRFLLAQASVLQVFVVALGFVVVIVVVAVFVVVVAVFVVVDLFHC